MVSPLRRNEPNGTHQNAHAAEPLLHPAPTIPNAVVVHVKVVAHNVAALKTAALPTNMLATTWQLERIPADRSTLLKASSLTTSRGSVALQSINHSLAKLRKGQQLTHHQKNGFRV